VPRAEYWAPAPKRVEQPRVDAMGRSRLLFERKAQLAARGNDRHLLDYRIIIV